VTDPRPHVDRSQRVVMISVRYSTIDAANRVVLTPPRPEAREWRQAASNRAMSNSDALPFRAVGASVFPRSFPRCLETRMSTKKIVLAVLTTGMLFQVGLGGCGPLGLAAAGIVGLLALGGGLGT
jgi:hypothetical protein